MRAALLLWPALAGLAGGCAAVRVDEHGRRHVVGLVWMTLPAPSVQPVGAETLRIRGLGLTLMHGPLGNAAVLGYGEHGLTALRNDAVVRGPIADAGEPTR